LRSILAPTILTPVMSLGTQYVSDFVAKEDIYKGEQFPLLVGVDGWNLGQLFHAYPPEKMYRKYWYHSGTNDSMRAELANIVESTKKFTHVNPGDVVLDIASNDGTLLTNWPDNVTRIGIDPSDVAKNSPIYQGDIVLVNDFFSKNVYNQATNKKAKVITLIAMFYDLPNPIEVCQEIYGCLDEHGIFVVQMSYTPLMLKQNAFDNIGHEHLAYYSLESLRYVFDKANLEIVDVELNDTNGGSFRVFAKKKGALLDAHRFVLDIGHTRFESILWHERESKSASRTAWEEFRERVEIQKSKLVGFLQRTKERGETVLGYGASTKANTLLQYYGIGPELLPCIAEKNERKWGLYTVGTGIPIISEAEMRAMEPDYLLVLPWHFINGFLHREKELRESGTKFIVPLPEFHIY
jgi:hypothetical protein